MTAPGPSDRSLSVDDSGGTPTNLDAVLISATGLGEIERIIEEVTGPTDTTPAKLDVGFEQCPDVVLVLQGDDGGSPDPVAMFVTTRTGSRTITATHKTGWTWAVEAFVKSVKPPWVVRGKTHVEVTLSPYGAITVT